jgi:hypothetical protein
MKTKLALVSVVLLGLILAVQADSRLGQAKKSETPAAKSADVPFEATGCVKKGVEAGCLILVSWKDNKTYSMHFKTPKKPALETVITIKALKAGADICMQGQPVNVSQWTQLKMKCPIKDKDKK